LPHNFAQGPPFPVDKGWRPSAVTIYASDPPNADVIAAALPTKGGMRVVVYNRDDSAAVVTLEDRV
jgi:hypothetical protein